MNIIITDENGRLTVSTQAVEKYQELQELIDTYTAQQKELKSNILQEMIKNKVTQSKVLGYTISLVQPKDKEIFSTEDFLHDEDIAIISLFTSFNEEKEFDVDMLKSKYPEIYNECCKTQTTYDVDVEKLKKSLPEVYKKYTKVEKSTKDATLQFRGGK